MRFNVKPKISLLALAVTYAWTPSTTLAVSARQGYNAGDGALNFTAQEYYYYDDEKVNTYELSSRTQFENGRGYFNANIFYNDYDGYQALSSTRYISEYYGDFTNTEERIAGDYTLVRLNASYIMDNWLLIAYVDNLFDETAFVLKEPASTAYPFGYAAIEDPRNVGFSVTYQF